MKNIFLSILVFSYISFGGSISISQHYDVKATPNIAILNIGFIEQDKDPKTAIKNLFKRTSIFIGSLRGYNVKTTSLSLNPIYDKNGNIVYFRAFEGIRVKVPIKNLTSFLGYLDKYKIDSIEGITFDVSNKEKLELIAIRKAMKLAKEKALAALYGTHYKIIGIKSCVINLNNYPRPIMFLNTSYFKNAPIKSGSVNIGANVNVVYKIGE